MDEWWEWDKESWEKNKEKFYKNSIETLEESLKKNIEKCKKLIKALEKTYDCEYKFKKEKFDSIILEDFSEEEKGNIIKKTITILKYLAERLKKESNDNNLKKVFNDIKTRLNKVKKAGIFPFLFKDGEINKMLYQSCFSDIKDKFVGLFISE